MDIAHLPAALKGQARRQPGNGLFIDRRQREAGPAFHRRHGVR
ncbi:hypothetical protein [Halomonas getboli]|nr:hypothetical protein [Halomonas getboli]